MNKVSNGMQKNKAIEQIRQKATEVFENPDLADKSLFEMAFALNDIAPLEYMTTRKNGIEEVLMLLEKIDQGLFS